MSSEDKAEVAEAPTSQGEVAAPAEAVANSNQPSNQSSSPKVEESNETKVPTTTTIETESREDQSSYLAPSSSSVEEAAKPEDLKGSSSSTINVESASENMNNDVEEEKEKDVEKFGGKIVYNPDGSAYIIDDEDDADDAVPALQGRYSVPMSYSKLSIVLPI